MGGSLLALAKSIYYITIEDVVINSRVYIFGFFIPKQGQGFKTSAAPCSSPCQMFPQVNQL